jgi:hypothetical protein
LAQLKKSSPVSYGPDKRKAGRLAGTGLYGGEAGIGQTIIAIKNADESRGLNRFLNRIMNMPKLVRPLSKAFALRVAEDWRNEITRATPIQDGGGGKLRASIRMLLTGGGFDFQAQPISAEPYAMFVARGTKGSPLQGEEVRSADYFSGAFGNWGSLGKNKLRSTLSSYTWEGQSENPYDQKGLYNAQSTGYFQVAAAEFAYKLLGRK